MDASILRYRLRGWIYLDDSHSQAESCKSPLETGAPFIVWGIPQPKQKYCSVTGDNMSGGRLATEHLIGLGRNRIGFIGGPAEELEVQHRLAGYQAALKDAGRETDPALIEYGDFSNTSG